MLLPHKPYNTRGIHDPPPVPTLMRFLIYKLSARVFTSEEDAAGVDIHDAIPDIFVKGVDWAMGGRDAYAGVVDHAIAP